MVADPADFHLHETVRGETELAFALTFVRGLQLPALAWLIGRTINGPISGRNLGEIYWVRGGVFLRWRW